LNRTENQKKRTVSGDVGTKQTAVHHVFSIIKLPLSEIELDQNEKDQRLLSMFLLGINHPLPVTEAILILAKDQQVNFIPIM